MTRFHQRQRPRPPRVPLLLLTFLLPTTALAATPTDVEYGTNIEVDALTVTVDGESRGVGGLTLQKPANSLSLSVPLQYLGIPSSGNLHASGTKSGNMIIWSFDEHLSVDLGGADDINRIHGWLAVQVQPMGFWETLTCNLSGKCSRNAKLDIVTSSIVIEGDTVFGIQWSEPVFINTFQATGGVGTPRLAAVTGPTQAHSSSGSHEHFYSTLHMSGPAPSSGATVEIASSIDPGLGFFVPSTVSIPPGKSSATVHYSLAPKFTGEVEILFASFASWHRRSFTALRPKKKKKKDPWDIREMVPWWVFQCIHCGTFLENSDPLGPLVLVDEQLFWMQAGEAFSLDEQGIYASDIAAVGSNGWITGMNEGGGFVGQFIAGDFVEFSSFGEADMELGESFFPTAVDAFGNVAGYFVDESGVSIAGLVEGGYARVDLGVPSEGSAATAMNDAGFIVGNTVEGSAFIANGAGFMGLFEPHPGGHPLTPTAVNAQGLAVGFAEVEGHRLAVVMSLEEGTQPIEGLEPDANSMPVGLTDEGVIFGNITMDGESRAFAHHPEEGLLDFDEYAQTQMTTVSIHSVSPTGTVIFEAMDEEGNLDTFSTQM